ncbi:MAG: hypothetical protein H8D97_00415 [Proteobacteria bacterium]|nr:hypothetical protein [Pseudomonadota bacterium]
MGTKIKLTLKEKESLDIKLKDWMIIEKKKVKQSKVKKKIKERIMKDVSKVDLFPGDFYEDCRYHPMLCISLDRVDGELIGLSLIDSKFRRCSYYHCGIQKLTPKQALYWRINGPEFTNVGISEGEESKFSYWKEQNKDPELVKLEKKLGETIEKDWKRTKIKK